MRFQTVDESATGHCCFKASVIDSEIGPGDDLRFVCECYSGDDAKAIAALLNKCAPRELWCLRLHEDGRQQTPGTGWVGSMMLRLAEFVKRIYRKD